MHNRLQNLLKIKKRADLSIARFLKFGKKVSLLLFIYNIYLLLLLFHRACFDVQYETAVYLLENHDMRVKEKLTSSREGRKLISLNSHGNLTQIFLIMFALMPVSLTSAAACLPSFFLSFTNVYVHSHQTSRGRQLSFPPSHSLLLFLPLSYPSMNWSFIPPQRSLLREGTPMRSSLRHSTAIIHANRLD